MKNVLQNTLAVFSGMVVGGAVNMTILVVGALVIPPPAGVDVSSTQSIRDSMHLFEARHFLSPFLAHALGTLAGALPAFLIAASHRRVFAYAIGVFFLAGGIAASSMIPAPAWFVVLDLTAAYLPMAWIGIRLGGRLLRGMHGSREGSGDGER